MLSEYRWITAIMALAAISCAMPTEPQALPISVQVKELKSESEIEAWPFTPTIEGGTSVRVRAFGPFGCGSGTGTALLRGRQLTVTISPARQTPVCPAIY